MPNEVKNLITKDCPVSKTIVSRGWVMVQACFDRKYNSKTNQWEDFEDLAEEVIDTELIYDLFETYMAKDSPRTILLEHKGEKVGEIIGCWPQTVEVASDFGDDITKSQGSGLRVIFKPDDITPFTDGTIKSVSIGFFVDEFEYEEVED